MTGWAFPTLFKSNTVSIEEGKTAVVTQLSLLINSEIYEYRYDPGYGSNVPRIRYNVDNQLTRDLLTDAIYDCQIFCPNIIFSRNDVKIQKNIRAGEYEVYISAKIDTNDYIDTIQLLVDASDA